MTSDPVAEQLVSKHLTRGERLLWAGRPKQGLILRPSDAFWIPFSLMWTGFAVFWEYQAITSGAPTLWRLWGVPFILAGLYLVGGRFLVDIAMRSRAYYGVASHHVVIVSGLRSQKVTRLSTRDIPMTLAEGRAGTGSIVFSSGSLLSGPTAALAWPGLAGRADHRFEHIGHAREVYELIRMTSVEERAAGK